MSSTATVDRDLTELVAVELARSSQGPVAPKSELARAAAETVALAVDGERPEALEQLHRSLYLLGAQSTYSPAGSARDRQFELQVVEALNVLDDGLERLLSRVELPEQPPSEPEAFCGWLSELTLEREPFGDTGIGSYVAEDATLDQMREIVAQRSIFFLKEPDPWAMVVPTLKGDAKAGLLDLLLDEYGWGRLEHMHSTVYARLMETLDLDSDYDAYSERAAWRFLATYNYQAMLARRTRLSRRMLGYIYLTEATAPAAMANYIAGYRRLGLGSPEVLHFYELHEAADEGHQEVALREVVLPVVREEPGAATEVARGVIEGMWLEHEFSLHLVRCFDRGHSTLRTDASSAASPPA